MKKPVGKRVAKKVTSGKKKLTHALAPVRTLKRVAKRLKPLYRGIPLGGSVPELRVSALRAGDIEFKALAGKKCVLFFYPKDNTPGCTLEGQDFGRLYKKFKALGVEVIGVSRDSLASHQKYADKFKFPFDLIADENEILCRAFDVIQEKNLYGKKSMGIERSTFVFDDKNTLVKEWRKVKVAGHAEEVLNFIKGLK